MGEAMVDFCSPAEMLLQSDLRESYSYGRETEHITKEQGLAQVVTF